MSGRFSSSRIGAMLPLGIFSSILIVYLCLTVPFGAPSHWQGIEPGVSRAQSNERLQVAAWQADNEAYLVFEKRGLRTWYIDVSFEADEVTSVRIFHEDLHDELIESVFYLWSYVQGPGA